MASRVLRTSEGRSKEERRKRKSSIDSRLARRGRKWERGVKRTGKKVYGLQARAAVMEAPLRGTDDGHHHYPLAISSNTT